jgi:hypothetical protein
MTKHNITVEQARKRLGDKAQNLSDKQVEGILNMLYTLSERVVNQVTRGGKSD